MAYIEIMNTAIAPINKKVKKMKSRIEFITYSHNAVEGLSLSLLGKVVSENALHFAFSPNGDVSKGVYRTKKAAQLAVRKMEEHVNSGKVGFYIGFKIVKAA